MDDSILKSIKEKQEYHMTNVLSFRRKLAATQMQEEVKRINAFIENGGYRKTGPTVTATFSVEQIDGQQIIDLEILIPLDREFTPPNNCGRKQQFYLVNALSMRHDGSLTTLQSAYDLLNTYIQHNNLQPITAGYNVAIRDADITDMLSEVVVDIYIGISPNIL